MTGDAPDPPEPFPGLEDLVPGRVPLLAWAGTAIAEAQALELSLATYLLIHDPQFDPSTDPVVLAKRFAGLRGDPLGALLRGVYGMSGASPETQRNFNELNRARIDVAHHIFTRSDYVAMAKTPEGCARLIELLRSWTLDFTIAAATVFDQALEGAARFGVDARVVYERLRDLGAGEEVPFSPAEALVGLEESITPETLERAARRLGIDPDVAP